MFFDMRFTTKTLNQTIAGELVRLRWSKLSLALVGFHKDQRVLIFLDGLASEGPEYLVPQRDAKVISYGTDYIVEIDQDPNFIDMNETTYYGVRGAIGATETGRFLYVSPVPNTQMHELIKYDFESGEIITPQNPLIGALFGKWKLHLPQSAHLPPTSPSPIFSFALKPVSNA